MGILITIIMIRKYRKLPTVDLATILEEDDIEDKIRNIIKKGEGSKVELKSTMRMNLKTAQPGKEIEIVWLKAANAFMNSAGGILLFGVNDAGEFIGIEPDKFENEDKCRLHFKNLINQHIGAEFTNYLNFKVLKIENKTIAILECKSSQKPVFLKDKNEEKFFIRSGPSSIRLQTSKVLEYIEDRKTK
jgi:predicted HTH transcriptional regulator